MVCGLLVGMIMNNYVIRSKEKRLQKLQYLVNEEELSQDDESYTMIRFASGVTVKAEFGSVNPDIMSWKGPGSEETCLS